jgi:LysM repeat protein
MKTPWVVAVVAAAHGVAVVSLVLMQGCLTRGSVRRDSVPEPLPIVRTPVVPQPLVKTPAPPPWPAQTKTYVVAEGDTLSELASRFGVSVSEIMALNGLKDADFVRSGKRLMLPGSVDLSAPSPRRRETVAPAGGRVYKVKAGDCLSVIAARFGTTVGALQKANGISGERIIIGQDLVVPAGSREEAPPAGAPGGLPEPNLDAPLIDVDPPGAREGGKVEGPAVRDVPDARMIDEGGRKSRETLTIRTHVVEEGEDLYAVAMMYGLSVADLKVANGLSGTDLQAGRRLTIPITQ